MCLLPCHTCAPVYRIPRFHQREADLTPAGLDEAVRAAENFVLDPERSVRVQTRSAEPGANTFTVKELHEDDDGSGSTPASYIGSADRSRIDDLSEIKDHYGRCADMSCCSA